MSSNIFVFNASLRHQIFLQRFGSGQARVLNQAIKSTETGVKSLISREEFITLSNKKLKEKLRAVSETVKGNFNKANDKLLFDMAKFAEHEQGFNIRMLDAATNVEIKKASKTLIEDVIFTKKVAFGLKGDFTIAEALTKFGAKTNAQVVQIVRDGVSSGLTNFELKKNLQQYYPLKNTQAKTLVRTMTNHVATSTRDVLYRENEDIISSEKYTATLDGRTTVTCASLDGKIFPLGKGPRPPMHWNCRSITVPIIKPEFNAVPDVKTTRFARGETGKTNVGGKTTYNSWLKGQSRGFQEEVLGVDKAKLFRDGGLKMDKFVDKNFKPLNLEQLKRREPLAFEKAGL